MSASVDASGWGCESVETKSASKPWEVDDGLGTRVEPLVPVVQRRYRHPGRRLGDDVLDRSRAAVDSSHIRAMKGGPATGPSPVDRGKTGSKHHVIAEGTIALPHWSRRLRIRWEIRDDVHHAFAALGSAVICWRRLYIVTVTPVAVAHGSSRSPGCSAGPPWMWVTASLGRVERCR